MTTIKFQVFLILTFLLYVIGCTTEKKSVQVTPQEADEIRAAIIGYMECEECTEGQLERLVAQGEIVIPSLEVVLYGGPSDAKRMTYELHLRNSYRQLIQYQETHPENKVGMNEGEYVQSYMDNYVALYQSRAAIALSAIGGESAKEILEDARDLKLREDVKSTIEDSYNKVK